MVRGKMRDNQRDRFIKKKWRERRIRPKRARERKRTIGTDMKRLKDWERYRQRDKHIEFSAISNKELKRRRGIAWTVTDQNRFITAPHVKINFHSSFENYNGMDWDRMGWKLRKLSSIFLHNASISTVIFIFIFNSYHLNNYYIEKQSWRGIVAGRKIEEKKGRETEREREGGCGKRD